MGARARHAAPLRGWGVCRVALTFGVEAGLKPAPTMLRLVLAERHGISRQELADLSAASLSAYGAAGRAPTWLGDWSGRIDVRCGGGFETRPYDVTVRFLQGCTGCTTRSWRSFSIDGCKGAACRAPTWLGGLSFDRLRMSGLFIGVAVGWREAGFPPEADLSAASLSAYGRGHAIIWTVVPWAQAIWLRHVHAGPNGPGDPVGHRR